MYILYTKYHVRYRCVVTNPPYGERLGGAATANEGIGQLMRQLDARDWGLFALSGDEYFEDDVGRTRCVCGERESEKARERAREREEARKRERERGREKERKRETERQRDREGEKEREGGREGERDCASSLQRSLPDLSRRVCPSSAAVAPVAHVLVSRLSAPRATPQSSCAHSRMECAYSTKRRKLYNGKLPCQLYQYPGPLPRRQAPRPVPGACGIHTGSGRSWRVFGADFAPPAKLMSDRM